MNLLTVASAMAGPLVNPTSATLFPVSQGSAIRSVLALVTGMQGSTLSPWSATGVDPSISGLSSLALASERLQLRATILAALGGAGITFTPSLYLSAPANTSTTPQASDTQLIAGSAQALTAAYSATIASDSGGNFVTISGTPTSPICVGSSIASGGTGVVEGTGYTNPIGLTGKGAAGTYTHDGGVLTAGTATVTNLTAIHIEADLWFEPAVGRLDGAWRLMNSGTYTNWAALSNAGLSVMDASQLQFAIGGLFSSTNAANLAVLRTFALDMY